MNDKALLKRLKILLTISGICMLILLFRLFYLQLIKGEHFLEIAPRGEIRDRNGEILAHDLPRMNICAVRAEIRNLDEFTRILSPLIGYTEARIKKILDKFDDNPYQKVVIKPKIDTSMMMRVAELQPDLPGLYLEVQPVREYPEGEIAPHVLGYVGQISSEELEDFKGGDYHPGDYIGKDGIERQYDKYLRGINGQRNTIVDAIGRVTGKTTEKKPKPGRNVFLTLDINFQRDLHQILKWHVTSLSKVSKEQLAAAAIVMDVKTGEILGMHSYPGFDPNSFSKGMSTKDYNALVQRKDFPMLDRVISGEYVPASTFKLITGAAGLQEKLCTRHTPFSCPGYFQVGGQKFNCMVTSGHGKVDIVNSISESCNTTFYLLGTQLEIDRILQYSRNFGLGKKTGIDLPGEMSGLLPDSYWKMKSYGEPWYTGDTINTSIGQGFLNVTVIQMAQATAAVANGGKVIKPHLLLKIEDTMENEPQVMNLVEVDDQHLAVIREGMITSVKKGTCRLLDSKISAGGKTGTAESFPSPGNPHGRNHTWFVGFAPARDPEIAVVVFFERSAGYAGRVTVPIASEILNSYHKHIYSKKALKK
jgi:penicillin-binding protein 2